MYAWTGEPRDFVTAKHLVTGDIPPTNPEAVFQSGQCTLYNGKVVYKKPRPQRVGSVFFGLVTTYHIFMSGTTHATVELGHFSRSRKNSSSWKPGRHLQIMNEFKTVTQLEMFCSAGWLH